MMLKPSMMALAVMSGLWMAGAVADGLNILVTNDDGFDSPGIEAVAEALRAAGHGVTVVAPLKQQSGSGMKISTTELELVEQAPGVWSVTGTPADAIGVALQYVMRDTPPDLVISGANFGQNLGSNVLISGTVGAAMMAVMHGVPAVAVSVGLDLSEATSEPRFGSTIAAFPGAARFTARLVAALASNRADGLLPAGHVLNVNYPARAEGAPPVGLTWARTSQHGGFRLDYLPAEEGRIKPHFEHDQAGRAETITDSGRFAAGYATLSVLTPDWNATDGAAAGVRARIGPASALLRE